MDSIKYMLLGITILLIAIVVYLVLPLKVLCILIALLGAGIAVFGYFQSKE